LGLCRASDREDLTQRAGEFAVDTSFLNVLHAVEEQSQAKRDARLRRASFASLRMTAKTTAKATGRLRSVLPNRPYIFSGDRAAVWRDLTPKLFLRIQCESLLVPIVLVRKELLRSPASVGFSTSD
jgi:hypothetical protein